MARIKSNKWKDVPVQPYTVTDLDGNETRNPLRTKLSLGLIPNGRERAFQALMYQQEREKSRKQYATAAGILYVPKQNNRKQRNSRGICPRMEPKQYVPNTVYLTAKVNGRKAIVGVKDGSTRTVLHNRVY